VFQNREVCCSHKSPLLQDDMDGCAEWHTWATGYWGAFAVYVGMALIFGIIAGSLTMTTRANLPAVKNENEGLGDGEEAIPTGKQLYSMFTCFSERVYTK
jgi:chloride channel 3/4/5